MTKKEFWEHLDSLSLNDSTVAHIENKRAIEKITKEIERIIPEKLYRYRTFDSENSGKMTPWIPVNSSRGKSG